MSANPDEFRFFLPSVGGEDTADATQHDGVMTEKEYAQYCHNVANTGEWGGEPEVRSSGFIGIANRHEHGNGNCDVGS